ncbi:MAG TPA: glycosyltransferase family 4 protein [Bryobacteraceae bacterium]|nr:glycosyltransferase family 4 protein [Bryobacteraceae bacterium]
MDRIRQFLKFAGKDGHKVAAVFGVSPNDCDAAVRHVRCGAPEVPVWLFASQEPWPGTASLCERVCVEPDSMQLLVEAEKVLWSRWVALSVGTWTGGRGKWPVKAAALLVPPFRALIMNRQGDFFPATIGSVARHLARTARDRSHSAWHRAKDVHRAAWLWLLGLMAQRLLWLSRRAFARGHGNRALATPDCPPAGEGVAVYRYHPRQWDWAEVDRFVQESGCRHILFLAGDAEDEIRWTGGPQTFAVSRQNGYRGWKPCLFPMAPFRTLQPEEVSRTLAPVSNAILVDRAKLAALGVPKTIAPGTAWLMLFWKAAAAGWHSYSVGATGAVRDTPDWPFEETEFVVRTLSKPGLRALGPRQPDLSRGTIATSGAGGCVPAQGGKPRVLVVSPYLPWPLSHGGAVRIWNLCRALCGRVDFTLAGFREKDDGVDYAKLREVFREVYVVDRVVKAVSDSALPLQVREHGSRSMRALIASLAPRMDLLQVEFTHMAAFRDAAPQLPAILVEHDLTFTLYQQFAAHERSRAARLEYERWLAFERRWFAGYDAVWTMSQEDRETAVREGSPAERTYLVANGVDLARFVPRDEAGTAPEIFYVGSFRHLPNILGFERLRHGIMPLVWRRYPEARLRVVAGPDPDRYWKEFLKVDYPCSMDPRIEIHRFVADLRPLYSTASVVAVPLLVSAGTNIKVMEAMACRKAVVTTPVGCHGLGLEDGRDAVIREWDAGFADAVIDLLGDPAARARIAAEARCTAECRFSWEAVAAQAWASYQAVARR